MLHIYNSGTAFAYVLTLCGSTRIRQVDLSIPKGLNMEGIGKDVHKIRRWNKQTAQENKMKMQQSKKSWMVAVIWL